MTPADRIRAAKALIDTLAKWTQHALARDSNDVPTFLCDPDATCFCIQGALLKTGGDKKGKKFIYKALSEKSEWLAIEQFNDRPDTSHTDVYADMMLEGVCCACCGTYMDDGRDDGFPRYCSDACDPYSGERPVVKRGPRSKPKPCACPQCGKTFGSKGARRRHINAKHSQLESTA